MSWVSISRDNACAVGGHLPWMRCRQRRNDSSLCSITTDPSLPPLIEDALLQGDEVRDIDQVPGEPDHLLCTVAQ